MIWIEWFLGALFLGAVGALFWHDLSAQVQAPEERSTALRAFLLPLPGGVVMTVAPFGWSPALLFVPALAYAAMLGVTRRQPLLLLGFAIDRIDRRVSDRYLGRLIVLVLVASFVVTIWQEG